MALFQWIFDWNLSELSAPGRPSTFYVLLNWNDGDGWSKEPALMNLQKVSKPRETQPDGSLCLVNDVFEWNSKKYCSKEGKSDFQWKIMQNVMVYAQSQDHIENTQYLPKDV